MSNPFEQDTIYELESPVDGNFGHFSTNFEEPQFNATYPKLNQWVAPPPQRMVHQALPRLTTQAPSPRFQADRHNDASPYLSSANSSLTPSPVSPVTPNLDTASHIQRQDWSIVSPISARPSSCQSFSHFMQQYAPQYPHHRTAYSEPASFSSTPVEGSLYTMGGSWNMESEQNSHFSTTPMLPEHETAHYQHTGHQLQLPAAPSLNAETSWDDDDFLATSNDHVEDDSFWTSFDIGSTQAAHNATDDVTASFDETQWVAGSNHDQIGGASNNEAIGHQNGGQGVMRNRTSSGSGRATPYPRERCHICDKEFTGRLVPQLQLSPRFNHLTAVF